MASKKKKKLIENGENPNLHRTNYYFALALTFCVYKKKRMPSGILNKSNIKWKKKQTNQIR